MKKRTYGYALCALTLAIALLASGCSSGDSSGGDQAASGTGLRVALVAVYVPDEATAALEAELAAVPALAAEGGAMPTVAGVSSGDSEADPMGTMAGMAKIGGMFAAGEIELMICDAENVRRYGDGGESYVALSELFTEEELAGFHAVAFSLYKLDDEGNEVGEESAPCGLDFSGNEALKALTGMKDPHAVVISGAKNQDLAKAALAHLAGLGE